MAFVDEKMYMIIFPTLVFEMIKYFFEDMKNFQVTEFTSVYIKLLNCSYFLFYYIVII